MLNTMKDKSMKELGDTPEHREMIRRFADYAKTHRGRDGTSKGAKMVGYLDENGQSTSKGEAMFAVTFSWAADTPLPFGGSPDPRP